MRTKPCSSNTLSFHQSFKTILRKISHVPCLAWICMKVVLQKWGQKCEKKKVVTKHCCRLASLRMTRMGFTSGKKFCSARRVTRRSVSSAPPSLQAITWANFGRLVARCMLLKKLIKYGGDWPKSSKGRVAGSNPITPLLPSFFWTSNFSVLPFGGTASPISSKWQSIDLEGSGNYSSPLLNICPPVFHSIHFPGKGANCAKQLETLVWDPYSSCEATQGGSNR